MTRIKIGHVDLVVKFLPHIIKSRGLRVVLSVPVHALFSQSAFHFSYLDFMLFSPTMSILKYYFTLVAISISNLQILIPFHYISKIRKLNFSINVNFSIFNIIKTCTSIDSTTLSPLSCLRKEFDHQIHIDGLQAL